MSKLIFNGHSYTGGSINPNLATDVVYDNTASGLSANNVQSAIDEIVGTYKTGDIISFNTTSSTKYLAGAFETSSQIRFFIPLRKTPIACTLSISYLEIYSNGYDVNQTSNISSSVIDVKDDGLWVSVNGNFTNPQAKHAAFCVLRGTITFT